jgi:hypothetical protein
MGRSASCTDRSSSLVTGTASHKRIQNRIARISESKNTSFDKLDRKLTGMDRFFWVVTRHEQYPKQEEAHKGTQHQARVGA